MRKVLEGNGLWETSRMMLPEHKQALNMQRRELDRRSRIELDDQELEQVGRALTESLELRELVKVQLYDEYEQLEVVGVVDRIDQYKQRFMVNGDWFPLKDIEGVQIDS